MDYFVDNKQIGERLRTLRRNRGYKSQDAFAEAIDVLERKTVGKWETGEVVPELSKLMLLAQTFGVTTDWLLSESEPEPETAPEPEAPPFIST